MCRVCCYTLLTYAVCAEPEKQFALVERHIARLRRVRELVYSEIIIMVERNLCFEAEHHHRALHGLPHTRFRIDHAAQRDCILTTEEVKYGMMTLFNNMLQRPASRLPRPPAQRGPSDRAPPHPGADEGLLLPVQAGCKLLL